MGPAGVAGYEVSRGGAPPLRSLDPGPCLGAAIAARRDGRHEFPAGGGRRARPAGPEVLFTFNPETAHGLSVAFSVRPADDWAPAGERLKVAFAALSLIRLAWPQATTKCRGARCAAGLGFMPRSASRCCARPSSAHLPADPDEAVINRLGFSNDGHEAAEAACRPQGRAGIVGVNIGANKDSTERIGDYERCVARLRPRQLPVNISSPNTPGLRNMRARGHRRLLSRLSRRVRQLQQTTDLLRCAGSAVKPAGGHRRRVTEAGRWHHRLQHHRSAALRSGRRGETAGSRNLVRALDHRAGEDAEAAWPRPCHHRRRRRRFR